MPGPIYELEGLLARLVEEYRALIAQIDQHRGAMTRLDMAAMTTLASKQDAIRQRIGALETRRRTVAAAAARYAGLPADATLGQLADAVAPRREALLALREQLRQTATELHRGGVIAARVAGAVLGHLNTAVRLISAAAGSAGTYTRTGVAAPPPRLGAIEAVG